MDCNVKVGDPHFKIAKRPRVLDWDSLSDVFLPSFLSLFLLVLGFGGYCGVCRILVREGTSQVIFPCLSRALLSCPKKMTFDKEKENQPFLLSWNHLQALTKVYPNDRSMYITTQALCLLSKVCQRASFSNRLSEVC